MTEAPVQSSRLASYRGKILFGVAAGAAVYVVFAAYADWERVRDALAQFRWVLLVPALGLAAFNYFLRFLKWQYYLRVLDLEVPWGESALVFLSGFTLTVTPGKLGEVLKSFLLKQSQGTAITRTAPIVVAERLTDLASLSLLAVSGAVTYQAGLAGVLVGTALVALGLGLVSSRRVCLAIIGRAPERLRPRLHELYESAALLLAPRPMVVATLLSVVAWFAECAAFAMIVAGFPGAHAALALATFIYAAMTIAGALSFLPGGLGVTEAGMSGLLVKTAQGVGAPVAVAATFLTRVCTLWFAVAVGCGALVLFNRRLDRRRL